MSTAIPGSYDPDFDPDKAWVDTAPEQTFATSDPHF
jgi:hypothetical protein